MKTQDEYYYLIHLQYLGYRFHGWAKQPEHKTVQGVLEKTVAYVVKHKKFKTLGSSRTDAGVSANHMAFQMFVKEPIEPENFLENLNCNLPADIRIVDIEEVDENFNIIQSPRVKEYLYLFSFGQKAHPFAASLMANFPEKLDLALLQEGARVFEGIHNYRHYCKTYSADTQISREVLLSRIEINSSITASFFPERSYAYHVHSKGFLRHQIRMMMGQLISLGRGDITLEQLKGSIQNESNERVLFTAPAAGLILNKIIFS